MSESDPNYRVIELEAENEHLKDDLIASLKERIKYLEIEVSTYARILQGKEVEINSGSNMIAPIKQKPIIRTMSEVSHLLEARSLNAKNLPVSAEDLNAK